MLTRLLFLAHHVHALGCTDLIPWFVLSLPPIVLKDNVSHLCRGLKLAVYQHIILS